MVDGAAGSLSAQDHAIAFWNAVEPADADWCEALTRLEQAAEGALRDVKYDPVKLADTDVSIKGTPIRLGVATLRRVESALAACGDPKADVNTSVALRRLDDLYAAMMLNMHESRHLEPQSPAGRPPAYAIATASRLWILGQIRDREDRPDVRQEIQHKIKVLAEVSAYSVPEYVVP